MNISQDHIPHHIPEFKETVIELASVYKVVSLVQQLSIFIGCTCGIPLDGLRLLELSFP